MMFHLYVASNTEEGGIYHFTCREEAGSLETSLIDIAPCPKPMYLAVHGDFLYAIARYPFPGSENSGLVRFPLDEAGCPGEPSAYLDTRGDCGCHLAVTDEHVYVVNYRAGNAVRLPDGKEIRHYGKGVHPKRQEKPHTHCIMLSPDGKELAFTDLGLDTVTLCDLDMNELCVASVPAGSGARHLVFSEDGRFLYCISELDASVHVFSHEPGRLSYQGSSPAYHPDCPEIDGAAIRLDERFLYVCTRGRNTLAVMKPSEDGALSLVQLIPCGGLTPRDFAIYREWGFSMNQDSGAVTLFQKCEEGLKPLGKDLHVPQAYSAVFYEN